jgi:hypothetical protein
LNFRVKHLREKTDYPAKNASCGNLRCLEIHAWNVGLPLCQLCSRSTGKEHALGREVRFSKGTWKWLLSWPRLAKQQHQSA